MTMSPSLTTQESFLFALRISFIVPSRDQPPNSILWRDQSTLNFHHGDYTLEDGCYKRKGQDDIQMTEGEFKLLTTLIQNAGSVLSRDQIMNQMERRDWFPTDRTIDVLIARIRRKLEDDRLNPRYINTAHGTGYVFVAEASFL